jgi:hypothetical protein
LLSGNVLLKMLLEEKLLLLGEHLLMHEELLLEVLEERRLNTLMNL